MRGSRPDQTSATGQTGAVRVEIHVRPRASTTRVGGAHNGALVVRVVEPPDQGRATTAALGAVADALAIPRQSVNLVHGTTNRRKVIEIDVSDSRRQPIEQCLARLLAQG